MTFRPLTGPQLRSHWDTKRQQYSTITDSGRVMIKRPANQPTRLHVIAPDNLRFPAEAVKLGGVYRQATGVWSFPIRMRDPVVELINKIFGADNVRFDNPIRRSP